MASPNVPITIKDVKGNILWQANRYVLATSAVAVSHTGDTNETALATITIPANLLGPNDRVTVEFGCSYTNSANTKTIRVRLGSISGTAIIQTAPTTTASTRMLGGFQNRNSLASQVAITNTSGSLGASSGDFVTDTVNFANQQQILITGQLASAGETITLNSYEIVVTKV